MIKKILALLLFSCFSLVFSQKYSDEYHKYKAKYPDARQVILEKQISVNIDIVNGKLEIHQEIFEDILLLNTSSSYDIKESVSSSSFYELEAIEAATLIYKKGKYKKIAVENFKVKDNASSSFYDDTKLLTFKYPNLGEGTRKILRYKEKVKNPRFLNSVFFASHNPIEHITYTLNVHKDIVLRFKEFHLDDISIEHNEKVSKESVLHIWEAKGIEAVKLESNVPDFRYFIPHIIPIIESYTLNKQATTLTKSPKDLYDWYYSLVKNINKESSDAEMIALVKSLTKGKSTNLEKAKAIYYWVQENIKYIAFEYALGGFVPRDANNVFNKKYGDCKDNSSILYEMLKIAGLEGNLTWIGTRDVPYSYYELPTPAVDNHMILSYTEADKTYYLDATGRYLSIDLPSTFIQGKEALIGKGKNNFEIKKVPVVAATKNTVIDTSYFKLNKNLDLEGKGSLSLSGYPKIDIFVQLEHLKTEEQYIDFYKKNLQKGNNNFLIKSYSETNKFNYDENFIVNYEFLLKNYVQYFEGEIYINLNLNTEVLNLKSQKERTFDKEFEYKKTSSYVNTFEIPKHMQLNYIPKDFVLNHDLIDCSISYNKVGNKLNNTLKVVQKFILITPKQQKELNDIVTKIQQQFKEVVVLKEITK